MQQNQIIYRLNRTDYVILFLVLFCSFFLGLNTYPLENLNEGLYAEIAREMLQHKNFIIPTLNYVPYIEKPPLHFWLTALSYRIFGVSELSARLIPALFASLTCLNMVYVARRLGRERVGWIAALILATSAGFICVGRIILFDMVLTGFFSAALWFFYLWFKQQHNISTIRLSYLFMGCAFLTKGAIALVLIPLIILLYIVVQQRQISIKKLLDPIGILLMCSLILSWLYLAIKQQPQFSYDYFINEQLLRYVNQRVPQDYHTGPWYFYIDKIFLYLFPWSFFGLLLGKNKGAIDKQLNSLLWLWILVPLIIFSLSCNKGAYYMIVAAPPLAWLLAVQVDHLFSTQSRKLFYCFVTQALLQIMIFTLLYVATIGKINWSPMLALDGALAPGLLSVIVLSALLLLIGIGLSIRWKNTKLDFLLMITLSLPLIVFYSYDKRTISLQHSEANLAHYINTHDRSRPVYLYQDFEKLSSLPFYLHRRLAIIDSQSQDLFYGQHHTHDLGWFKSATQFAAEMKTSPHYVVVRNKRLDQFLTTVGGHYHPVFEDGSAVLLESDN